MENIYVIYWSQTGNTEEMAKAVANGVEAAGKKVKLCAVSDVKVSDLDEANVFALGCPAMGAEVLEESEMEPFVAELEKNVSGKTIALFGSYGWGDGEWMRDWVVRMSNAGATVLNGAGLICQEMPDDDAISACVEMGKVLAAV